MEYAMICGSYKLESNNLHHWNITCNGRVLCTNREWDDAIVCVSSDDREWVRRMRKGIARVVRATASSDAEEWDRMLDTPSPSRCTADGEPAVEPR